MISHLALLAVATVLPSSTWGLDRIDTTSTTATGDAVDIYIIDSGIAPHPDLAGRIAPGVDLVTGSGDGTTDCNGHGTHVAGIAAGTTTGVAPDATVIPVRILDCNGSGSSSAVDLATDWIVNRHRAGEPAVANLSLIGPASDALDAAAQRMIDDGITVVVAAGNLGVDACTMSPSRLPDVITVAASDINDERPSWSNFGACIDLHAPGDRITSLSPDGGVATRSGTSTASPHVAGAAARILATDPTASPAEVANRLISAAVPVVTGDDSSTTPLLLQIANTATRDTGIRTAVRRTSARLVDTRSGLGGIAPGPLTSGDRLVVPIGIEPSASSATAVLTTTVTGTIAGPEGGFLTVEPCVDVAAAPTNISTLNFTSGQTVANTAFVPVGPDGTVCLSVYGSAEVIVDLQTVLSDNALTPVTPFRRLDTRSGLGADTAQRITTGVQLHVPVTGGHNIPSSGVAAISANLTVTDTTASATGGFVTVQPCDGTQREVSNLNFTSSQTVANAMVVAVGRTGEICVSVFGAAHVIIDINGWIADGSVITVVSPTRLLDTRSGPGGLGTGDARATRITVDLGTSGLIPASATASIVNLTVTDTTAPAVGGYLVVHRCSENPQNSNLNFTSGDQRAVTLLAPLEAGRTCITIVGRAAVIIDLAGYVAG